LVRFSGQVLAEGLGSNPVADKRVKGLPELRGRLLRGRLIATAAGEKGARQKYCEDEGASARRQGRKRIPLSTANLSPKPT
jgi:hypothetical protein